MSEKAAEKSDVADSEMRTEALEKSPWTEHQASDGRKYYFNNETKESRWAFPEEILRPEEEKRQREEKEKQRAKWEAELGPIPDDEDDL